MSFEYSKTETAPSPVEPPLVGAFCAAIFSKTCAAEVGNDSGESRTMTPRTRKNKMKDVHKMNPEWPPEASWEALGAPRGPNTLFLEFPPIVLLDLERGPGLKSRWKFPPGPSWKFPKFFFRPRGLSKSAREVIFGLPKRACARSWRPGCFGRVFGSKNEQF